MATYDPLLDADMTGAPIPDAWGFNLDAIAPGTTQAVAQQQGSNETWYDALARTLPLLVMSNQQRQLLQVQTDRAKAGLPPLDASQYSAGVSVGLSPSTLNTLLLGGLALGGLVLFTASRGRR